MHYYKFNIADYRKDTAHLSPMEHYIYRQLIDWYYLDESAIPKKTQVVLRRLCLGTEQEPALLNVLSDFFKEGENGWVHHRIEAEIAEFQAVSEKNRENGKKGGRPKKQEDADTENPSGFQSDASRNPNHKPITKKKNTTPLPPSLPDGLNIAAWDEYASYRTQAKLRALKPASVTKQQQWLVAQGPPDVQQRIVDQTIRNNWQGLFELKEAPRGTQNENGGGHRTRAQRVEAELRDIALQDIEARRNADGGSGGDLCDVLPALPAQVG